MSLWAKVKATVSRWFATTLQNPASWFVEWLRGDSGESDSGVAVNGKTVLSYAPLWYLVSKIAGHMAQLPCHVHEQKSEREAEIAKRHPAYKLVKWRSNPHMNADVFRETLQAHTLLHGNGRAAIARNNRNDPSELIILLPDRTVTLLINGEKCHVVTLEDGSKVKIPDADVLHIPGLGFDGIQGYSLIEMAKNSIGLGLAAEKHTNKHFKHNAMPGVIIEAPAGFFRDEKEAKKFLSDFAEWHSGVDNTSKPALMREGMKATTLSMNGRDAQWIEQRIFQRQEAALWMVCEQILGDDSSVSYNSLEQKNLAYLTNCLNRWLVRWELEMREKLLTGLQKRQESHYFKFNRNALLAMSANDRADFYTKMRAIEAISANEVREKEDMPPYDGGDTYDNPAINPKQPGRDSGGTEGQPPAQPTETDDERMANLIAMVIAKIPPAVVQNTVNVPEQVPPTVTVEGPVINVPEQAAPIINVEPSQVTVENRIDTPHAAVTAQLVTARLKEIAAVECHRASEAATKQKNFVAWLEDFYSDQGFLPRLRAVWQQVGGTEAGADAYAAESKAMLLEAAGSATSPEVLAATVAGLSGRWTARADEQAGLLLAGFNSEKGI